jgi:dipeptidase D
MKDYKKLFGQNGIIQVDHAGLECSVILGKYPNLDVVSFGPTMKSPHTTSERALIETVEPFWTLLKKVLEDIPEK